MRLSKKQRAFVDEYLRCWSAAEAARRAGYSEKTAYSQGPRLLKKVEVAAEIQKRIDEKCMSADEVLVRLAEQARDEASQYLQPDGSVNLDALIADGKQHLIKSIKRTKYGLDVEFYDAQSALQLIGRHHRQFVDRMENETVVRVEGLDALLDKIYGSSDQS